MGELIQFPTRLRPVPEDIERAARLSGLELNKPSPCHGYANACVCPDCLDRCNPPKVATPAPAQPWDKDAA